MSSTMKHGKYLLPVLLLAFAAILVGCGGGTSTTSEPAENTQTSDTSEEPSETSDASGKTIGMSMPFLSSPGYSYQAQVAPQVAEEEGLVMLEPTDAQNDPGEQVTQIRTLIDSGAEGIIVTPADSNAIAPALDYAESKGVPVIAEDTAPENGKVYATVRANNTFMGEEACKEMGKLMNEEGEVLSLQGDLASNNGLERTEGFANCMKENFPNIKVIGKPTHWEADQAATALQTVLTSNPNLAGVYLQSDCVMMAAVEQVLKQAGKLGKVGEPNHIATVTIDGCPLGLENIRKGYVDATIAQPLNLYAELGVKLLKEALEGKEIEAGPGPNESEITDYKGNPQVLLPSPVITKANASDEALFGNQVEEE